MAGVSIQPDKCAQALPPSGSATRVPVLLEVEGAWTTFFEGGGVDLADEFVRLGFGDGGFERGLERFLKVGGGGPLDSLPVHFFESLKQELRHVGEDCGAAGVETSVGQLDEGVADGGVDGCGATEVGDDSRRALASYSAKKSVAYAPSAPP